jgi:hypothetical protein
VKKSSERRWTAWRQAMKAGEKIDAGQAVTIGSDGLAYPYPSEALLLVNNLRPLIWTFEE